MERKFSLNHIHYTLRTFILRMKRPKKGQADFLEVVIRVNGPIHQRTHLRSTCTSISSIVR